MLGGSLAASSFLAPVVLGLYWRRATASGAFASMIAGAMAVAVTHFYPLWGVGTFVWGLAASLIAGILVSLLGSLPPNTAKLFDRGETATPFRCEP